MSLIVPAGTSVIEAEVSWGDYRKTTVAANERDRKVWQRAQRIEEMPLKLPKSGLSLEDVPGSRGLRLYVSVREVSERVAKLATLDAGARVVSVFVVNERDTEAEERADEANVYQVELCLRLAAGFVARPNVRGRDGKDTDERIADVQYQDARELAVGHGVATHAVLEGSVCREVRTCWVPVAAVEKVGSRRCRTRRHARRSGSRTWRWRWRWRPGSGARRSGRPERTRLTHRPGARSSLCSC